MGAINSRLFNCDDNLCWTHAISLAQLQNALHKTSKSAFRPCFKHNPTACLNCLTIIKFGINLCFDIEFFAIVIQWCIEQGVEWEISLVEGPLRRQSLATIMRLELGYMIGLVVF